MAESKTGHNFAKLGRTKKKKKKKENKKQEMLQSVTNALKRSLILTLIPGCDLKHIQETRVLQRT